MELQLQPETTAFQNGTDSRAELGFQPRLLAASEPNTWLSSAAIPSCDAPRGDVSIRNVRRERRGGFPHAAASKHITCLRSRVFWSEGGTAIQSLRGFAEIWFE